MVPVTGILFALAWCSCGFEAESDGADEGAEVIDDALVEVVELRPSLFVELGVSADGTEKPGGERRVDAFEEFEEYQRDGVALRAELIAPRLGKLGDQGFGPEL